MPRKIEISYRTIIFSALFGIFLWFLYTIRDIVVMVFISGILTSALTPIVDTMQKWKFPRSLAIGILYVGLWLTVGVMLAGLVPTVIEQTGKLATKIPAAVSQIEFLNVHQQELTQQFISSISTLPENVFRFTFDLFGNVISVLTTLVITFYLLLDRKNLDKYIPDKFADLLANIESSLGAWLRGELVLMLAVGTLTYIGLFILGVDNALPLAILAGVLEIIPSFGPIISAVPAVLVALTINPVIAVATGILYWVVQLIENNLLVPRIMAKAVGVSPVVVLLGLMVGFRLDGPVGAIMAVPVLIIVKFVLTDIIKKPGGW